MWIMPTGLSPPAAKAMQVADAQPPARPESNADVGAHGKRLGNIGKLVD